MSPSHLHDREHRDLVVLYALQALSPDEARAAEAQIAACDACRREAEALRPLVDAFVAWPTDVLRPSASLRERVAQRIAAEAGGEPVPLAPSSWTEPDWEEVAPGIEVKLLATDAARDRVSMLVRLASGVDYPPHRHGGVEELHLLAGKLWIDDRELQPGDYSRAEPGSSDARVWSETGCTCVLVTSPSDVIA